MGTAIAARLRERGHDVVVWNRTPEKTAAALAAGATAAATPRDLAARVASVITILTDAAAIDAVYGGPDGLLSADVHGKLFIEMSTVRPATERALAERVIARGATFVECPVSGTVGPAREGKLIGLVGADADAFARAQPVLAVLCRRADHLGAVGAGAAAKLAVNLMLMNYWQSLGEALALTAAGGVDAAAFLSVLGDASAGANLLKPRGPAILAALGGATVAAPAVTLDVMRKDLRTMLDQAAEVGVQLPVTATTLQAFERASAAGAGGIDATEIPAYFVRSGARDAT
jgi:3-hydroxyisobutyrate dehydrogenase